MKGTQASDNGSAPIEGTHFTSLNYGGQAVIEGVMMRGSRALAVAVRNPQGVIVVHTEPLDPRIYAGRLARIPFLRGLTLLWDALGLGIKSLLFSAEVALQEESESEETGEPHKVFEGPLQWTMVAFSLSLSILLFFVLPTFLASLIERAFDLSGSPVAVNFFEGMIRLLLLVGYIWAIGFVPDIRRVFQYHGAEHMTIHAYENGRPLVPAAIRDFP